MAFERKCLLSKEMSKTWMDQVIIFKLLIKLPSNHKKDDWHNEMAKT